MTVTLQSTQTMAEASFVPPDAVAEVEVTITVQARPSAPCSIKNHDSEFSQDKLYLARTAVRSKFAKDVGELRGDARRQKLAQLYEAGRKQARKSRPTSKFKDHPEADCFSQKGGGGYLPPLLPAPQLCVGCLAGDKGKDLQ